MATKPNRKSGLDAFLMLCWQRRKLPPACTRRVLCLYSHLVLICGHAASGGPQRQLCHFPFMYIYIYVDLILYLHKNSRRDGGSIALRFFS